MNGLSTRAVAGMASFLVFAGAAHAQVAGGSLSIVMRSSPGNFDCHAAQGYSNLQAIAPAYSTLLKYEPGNYPNIVGDLAEAWEISEDGLVYSFRLHDGVKFHDGTGLTAKDVRASYERMKTPPEGVSPLLTTQFSVVDSIETPDDRTVVIKLAAPSPSLLYLLANPTGCIYSAAKIEADPKFPSQNVMGTGPFKFGEFVTGSKLVYEKFGDYFRDGLPYLDRLEYLVVSRNGVVPALAGGQIDADFFTLGAPLQTQVKQGRGDGIAFDTGGTSVSSYISYNLNKPPFDDPRVRKALTLAIDRPLGEANLPKLISIKGHKPPIFLTGSGFELSDEDMASIPGFGTDIGKAREEAKALLKEAGAEGLKFELLAIGSADPFETYAVFVIDQWRQIGVEVTKKSADLAGFLAGLSSGQYDAAIEFNSPMSMDPNEVLAKHTPGSPTNYTGSKDEKLASLASKIQTEMDRPARVELTREFQRHLLGEGYAAPLYWATRTTAIPSNLKGWKIPPNFSLGLDLSEIWLEQ